MTQPSGSPRGTIHLHPAGACPPEIEESEIEEKQDNRGSVGKQLERIQTGIEKIAKTLYANTYYEKNMHPYVDPCPRDDTPHLFKLYEESHGFNTSRPGFVIMTMDGARVNNKPLYEFFGKAIDFVHGSIEAIPELSHVYICIKDMVPDSIYSILAHEFPKIGVKLCDDTKFSGRNNDGKYSQKITEDTREHEVSPSQRSKMQDGYHKLRGFPVASKRGRILRIALHVARTPEDEKSTSEEEWAIFPDEPTQVGEPDTISKFSTRDEAVREMHRMEGNKDKEIDEEVINASENINANVMHDWMTPEEAVAAAWSLREKSKIQQESLNPEEEEV